VAGQPEFFAGGLLVHNCVTFTGAAGERSPDRLDSLVWACTPFLDHDFDFSGIARATGARQYALARELEAMGRDPRERRRRSGDPAQREHQAGAWDVDSFAPQDDAGRPTRPNVHSWR
jgi:hypothetical protein